MAIERPDEPQWSVRVSARQKGNAAVYARKRHFEVGAPLSFDPEEESTSALEYVLGALGADLAVGLKQRCRRHRLDVDQVEVLVHGKLENPLTFLGVIGEVGSPKLEELTLKVFVETMESDDEIQRVWDETLVRSPLYCTFSSVAKINLELQIVL